MNVDEQINLTLVGLVLGLLPPTDGDDDGDVAEAHHDDGEQPRQSEEVQKVDQLRGFVC